MTINFVSSRKESMSIFYFTVFHSSSAPAIFLMVLHNINSKTQTQIFFLIAKGTNNKCGANRK